APTLLASAVGLIAAARAEPAPAAPAAAAECLAKPNATAAPGNHWYYRLERASGRHCWYQRPLIAGQNDAAPRTAPARASGSPPAVPSRATSAATAPELAAAADQPADVPDQNAAARVMAAPAQPYSWATAAPALAPAPAPQVAAPASEAVAPAPAQAISPTPQ